MSTKAPIVHRLKCREPYFSEQWNGYKRFEFRKLDRPFKVGDFILLELWVKGLPSMVRMESYMLLRITCILTGDGQDVPLPPDYAVLGTEVIARSR